MALKVLAPLSGAVVPLSDVPDPVFAEGLVGPGVAIEPSADAVEATAPIAGRLVKIKPHAFVVVSASGRGVLVHLGIDTVKLSGSGFTVLRGEGEDVAAGDPIVRWTPIDVRAAGLSAICPIVALDASGVADVAAGGISAGETLFTCDNPGSE